MDVDKFLQDGARLCCDMVQLVRGNGGKLTPDPYPALDILISNWLSGLLREPLPNDLALSPACAKGRKTDFEKFIAKAPSVDAGVSAAEQLAIFHEGQQYSAALQLLSFCGIVYPNLRSCGQADKRDYLLQCVEDYQLPFVTGGDSSANQLLEQVVAGLGARLAFRGLALDTFRRFAGHADRQGLKAFYETLVQECGDIIAACKQEGRELDSEAAKEVRWKLISRTCGIVGQLAAFNIRHFMADSRDSHRLPLSREAYGILCDPIVRSLLDELVEENKEKVGARLGTLSAHEQFVAVLLVASAAGFVALSDVDAVVDKLHPQSRLAALIDRSPVLAKLAVYARANAPVKLDLDDIAPVSQRFRQPGAEAPDGFETRD